MNLSKIEIVKAKLSDVDKLQLLGERTFIESFSSQNTTEDMVNYLSESFNRKKILSEFLIVIVETITFSTTINR